MLDVMLQMTLIIACGVLWRCWQPGSVNVQQLRLAITSTVYYLLLPALIIQVMWQAPIGWDSLRIATVAGLSIISGMLLAGGIAYLAKLPAATAGAVILAAAFPNAIYFGLPVLATTFGPWARGVAIQYDMLAGTPLLMTVGIWLAARYGSQVDGRPQLWQTLLKVPPLWATLIAITLNISGVSSPALLDKTLAMLGACVVPLMLLSLGMSLQWRSIGQHLLLWLVLVLLVQLFLVPAIAWLLANAVDLQGQWLAATVLEAAMPSMVLGIVICDRFGLNTAFYAAAVTISTIISLLTLPLWLAWVNV